MPLAAHSIVAVRVRSTTFSWGPMSMLGKPGGSWSSGGRNGKTRAEAQLSPGHPSRAGLGDRLVPARPATSRGLSPPVQPWVHFPGKGCWRDIGLVPCSRLGRCCCPGDAWRCLGTFWFTAGAGTRDATQGHTGPQATAKPYGHIVAARGSFTNREADNATGRLPTLPRARPPSQGSQAPASRPPCSLVITLPTPCHPLATHHASRWPWASSHPQVINPLGPQNVCAPWITCNCVTACPTTQRRACTQQALNK